MGVFRQRTELVRKHINMMRLRCSKCKKTKSPNDFHVGNRPGARRNYTCKLCRKLLAGPGEVIRARKWRNKHPIRAMLARAKRRAIRAGVAFSISEKDIYVPRKCPILGVQLIRAKKRMRWNSPSLDRIRPALGYVLGNIQVISMRANTMKNNATTKQLRRFANWVDAQYGKTNR